MGLRALFLGSLLLLASLGGVFAAKLTPLADPPDWKDLEQFQNSALSASYTRAEFTRLVDRVYSPDGGFWRYSVIDNNGVTVYSDTRKKQRLIRINFQEKSQKKGRSANCKCGPPREKPLDGIRICLDPGHIGGAWAKLEERYFAPDPKHPVLEAELNLITCRLIEKRLKTLGATVVWTKNNYEPVTSLRPDDIKKKARESLRDSSYNTVHPPPGSSLSTLDYRAAVLFYRNAEIIARARRVKKLEPDLTLCVHFNAGDWGSPSHPAFSDSSRLVIFVNGCYTANELSYEDQKFCLLQKVLSGSYPMESSIANSVARHMEKTFDFPAERSNSAWKRIGPHPYVFARNLLASRFFECPVVYVEGPYMNARDSYKRIQAGDFEGFKKINGRKVRSIYRDYADAVVDGVADYFKSGG